MMNNTRIINDSPVRTYQGVFGFDGTYMDFAFRGIDVKAKRIDSIALFGNNAPHAEFPIENIASVHEISRQNSANGTDNANNEVGNFHCFPPCDDEWSGQPSLSHVSGETLEINVSGGYTESLSKINAVIPPRQSAAFFMPKMGVHPSLVGVENSHTKPERGKLYAASFMPRVRPTARIEGGLSQKINEVSMTALTFRDVTFDIRTIRNITYITSVQLSEALGYSRADAAQKIYNRNKDEFTPEMSLPQIGVAGMDAARLFSLRGAHLVAMFARTHVAKEFRKWVLDVLDRETKADINLLQPDYFAKVRDIAIKFADDWVRVGKGEDVHPTLTIPDDVLAGIIAQQLSRQNFRLYVDYAGRLMVDAIPNKSPYEGLAEAIEDKGNIGLSDETIREIGRACVNALAYRAQSRKARITGGKK